MHLTVPCSLATVFLEGERQSVFTGEHELAVCPYPEGVGKARSKKGALVNSGAITMIRVNR